MKHHKRKLKNYLIDWRFQLGYTALVILSCLITFSVLGYMYWKEFGATQRVSEVSFLLGAAQEAEGLDDLDMAIEAEMQQRSLKLMAILLGSVALMVLFLGIYSIIMTHRAAGPVYAVSAFIRKALKGDYSPLRPLRKGDYFEYLHHELGELLAFWSSQKHIQQDFIDRLEHAAKTQDSQCGQEILALISRFKQQQKELSDEQS